jgi:2-polyprenyl-3-methyl-5-hydroxy-6-metoxy-1,4-benzoquinol methylase
MDACVGDVQARAEEDVRSLRLSFEMVDLMSDERLPDEKFDLVVLQEVIEHLPRPPYVVFRRIMKS